MVLAVRWNSVRLGSPVRESCKDSSSRWIASFALLCTAAIGNTKSGSANAEKSTAMTRTGASASKTPDVDR